MGKIQFANNFGAEKRNHVGAFGKKEAWDDFFGDGGAAEHAAAFEDDHFFAGFGQVGGVDEAIVTASDDNDIVELRHALGLQYEEEEFDETWNETFY
jgi:hypothetical protein